jgi:hypothetical protein
MDEIFGYFPPVANPPSKGPLLTLLKQGRAYGLGVVLATQNPVDLDYKGLANTGTWFIGRLQTERDKARVLEGLEGAAAGAGSRFDRGAMEETLAGLGSRVFLLNNVHEDQPVVFETRWVMSYLRGPLTREQIKQLMEPRRVVAAAPAPARAAPPGRAATRAARASGTERPVLPLSIPQHFIPLRGRAGARDALIYHPSLFAAAEVRFSDRKTGVEHTEELVTLTELSDGPVPVDWDAAEATDIDPADLEAVPENEASFAELPSLAARAKSYTGWKKELKEWLYRNQTLELLKSPTLREYSQAGESERDFRVRLRQRAREARDEALEKLRKRYASKIATLQERVRTAERAVAREAEQAKQAKMQTAISFGATLLSAMVGRKTVSRASLGRATTAARGVGRSMKQAQDVDRAEDTLEARLERLRELEAEFEVEMEEMRQKYDPEGEELETVVVRPKKKDIAVKLVALAWTPFFEGAGGEAVAAYGRR